MQVLNDKDDALYAKLVRLAGGNSSIVMKVLSNPSRSRVSLTTVMQEIEALRDAPPHSPVTARASGAAVPR